MRFMNEYEIRTAVRVFDKPETPNLARAAVTLQRLVDWTNSISDGWTYWPKSARAAARLMELIEGDGTYAAQREREDNDVSDAELRKALAPIKAFLTRQGVDHAEVFPEPVDPNALPKGYRWMSADEAEWYISRPTGVDLPHVFTSENGSLAIREN